MAMRRLIGVISGTLIIGLVAATAPASAQPTDRLGDGEPELTWRSPKRLPVTDGRPEFRIGGRTLGYPEVGRDGRTLTLPGVDLTAGQTDRLEVWLGADRLDTVGQRDLPRLGGEVDPPMGPTTTPRVDPGEPGDLDVTRFDYRSTQRPWPAYESPLEVVGHVVLPENADDAPLVLFLHGRHSYCYGGRDDWSWPCADGSKPIPSQLGYDYLQRVLASQGYATVSIAANAINAQDFASPDGGASARSALVRHHLRLLAQWTADPSRPRWYGSVDLDRVVLVGHSRGGEGVDQAVIDSTADAPYTISGQVLIGPVDFAYQTAGYMPTVVLLPYCDGDVFDLQGQRYVDAAGTVIADDPTLRSSVLLRGANHNFFNTEWTPGMSKAPSFDDWGDPSHPLCGSQASPTRLSAGQQRRAARTFVGAAVHGFLEGDPAALDVLDSDLPVKLPDAGDAVAWTHAIGGERDTVRAGAGATVTGAAEVCRSGAKATTGFRAVLPLCGLGRHEREVHWTRVYSWWLSASTPYFHRGLTRQLRLTWDRPGVVGGLRLTEPLDLSGPDAALDLRVVSDPGRHPTRVAVRLTDDDGTSWTSPRRTIRRLPGGRGLVAVWARTLRIDPAGAAGFDRGDIRSIDLVSRSDSGRVWVLDASARRPGIAPAPETPLPSIRIGRVTVREGDAGGTRIAELPYTVVGDVTAPGRFAVAMTQGSFGPRTPNRFAVVTVSPGDTSGVVEVPYESDTRDDRDRMVQSVLAVPLKGLAMRYYFGRVTITDDDPTPRLRLDVRRQRIGYGGRIVFVARLSAPVDYSVWAELDGVVLDRFRPLRVGDVRDRWIRRRLATVPSDRAALARWIRGDDFQIDAGSVRWVFRVPTKSHPPNPRAKALTLRASSRMLGQADRATVRVR